MKILYCHDNFYYRGPAGQVYSQGQFHHSYWSPFLDVFHELTVMGRGETLSKRCDTARLNLSSTRNVRFELLPNMNSPWGLIKHKSFISSQIARIVSEHEGVIVRAVSEIGWLAYREAKKQGKPVAMEMAACAWDSTWNHGSLLGRVYAPVRMSHDLAITAGADFVLYVSRDFLPRRYPAYGKTAFASNVRIDPPGPDVLARRLQRLQAANGNGDKPFVIGLIGTLSHKLKGVHDALHALKLLRDAGSRPFIFRHLGPGKAQDYQALASELGLEGRVFFDGMVPSGEAVLQWLDGVDLYIQPSYQEGLPRAMIEAMSRGCPVIGSTAGGIPELLPATWLHRPGDARKLSALIRGVMDDNGVQMEMARRNFGMARNFGSDILMPRRKEFWLAFRDHIMAARVPEAAGQNLAFAY